MKTQLIKSLLTSFLFVGSLVSVNAASTPLSEMTASEIISLVPVSSQSVKAVPSAKNGEAISLSGEDLLTKAYGTVSATNSKAGVIAETEDLMKMTPSEEESYLWLDSAEGYNVEYNGMSPDVSALVRLENDSISDYGFFFLFPYDEIKKGNVNEAQRRFSLAMLEDFEKIGADMGANAYTSDLFEVNGDYSNNYLAMRLIDDPDGERYILFLSVEPNALSEADSVVAE
ncbi:MAG: hypothetical protein K2L89_01560 [Muribaculaceae bacterium]|nr:hypothetical protein [Muribaculaceae bacterium]